MIWVGRSWFYADVMGGMKIAPGIVAEAVTVDGLFVLDWRRGRRSFDYYSNSAKDYRPVLDQIWDNVPGVRWLGVGWRGGWFKVVILPLWLVPVLTAILPLRWWRLHRSRHQTYGFEVVEPTADQT